jgi:hypothetical protein
MKSANVTTSATEIVPEGWRPLLSIQNISDTDIYLKFDGSEVALTTSNGHKLAAGDTFWLNHDARRDHVQAIEAIHGGVGSKEVRIQGVD